MGKTYRKNRVVESFDGQQTLAQQNMAAQTTIQHMVKKHLPGQFAQMTGNHRQPMFGDFSNLPDLQESVNRAKRLNDAFAQLPAAKREMFHNDSHKFAGWISDPANHPKAIELGLLVDPNPRKGGKAAGAPQGGSEPPPPQAGRRRECSKHVIKTLKRKALKEPRETGAFLLLKRKLSC